MLKYFMMLILFSFSQWLFECVLVHPLCKTAYLLRCGTYLVKPWTSYKMSDLLVILTKIQHGIDKTFHLGSGLIAVCGAMHHCANSSFTGIIDHCTLAYATQTWVKCNRVQLILPIFITSYHYRK